MDGWTGGADDWTRASAEMRPPGTRLQSLLGAERLPPGEANGASILHSLFHPLIHGSHQGPGEEEPMDPSSVSSLLVTHLGDGRWTVVTERRFPNVPWARPRPPGS